MNDKAKDLPKESALRPLEGRVPKGDLLIVDDKPANLRLLASMLVEQGYKVRSAINGPLAITATQVAPPDMILLDINMPEMNGYEVCERLKADESDAHSETNQGLRLRPGDQVLLCTDGLTDLVEKDEIFKALHEQSPRDAVISLVDLARARGGHDNITVVLLTALKISRRTTLSRRAAWILITFAGSVGLICLTMLSLASGWWFDLWPWSSVTPTLSSTHTAAVAPAIDLTSTITPSSLTTPTPAKTYTRPPRRTGWGRAGGGWGVN